MTNIKTIWDKVLEMIEPEISELSFNTWIKRLIPVTIKNDNFLLTYEEDLIVSIAMRYVPLIENALLSVTSNNYKVIIIEKDDILDYEVNTKEIKKSNFSILESNLNPRYTFENFVVGNSNKFAHAASLAVADAPAKAYNPLFLYGGVGLGKTHLMHAIGNYIKKYNPDAKVLYITSESFTNELINSIKGVNSIKEDINEKFRQKYRNIDVLLVDDIQFIAGKERTQEEFFHTFNSLHDASKQIILTSDRPPKEIKTLEDRLRSRFEWGLIGDIQAPDLETRIAILQKKAFKENLIINDEIFLFIAERIKSNIRELEGALNRVVAASKLQNEDISIDLAKDALKDILSTFETKIIDTKYVIETVSKYFDISESDILSKRRTKEVSSARHIAMYIIRNLTDYSLPKIGSDFNGRDHTTVLHAISKISKDIKVNRELELAINDIIKNIKER